MFINRVSECEVLAEHRASVVSSSRFILLSAPSGIGKSGLIDHVFKEKHSDSFIRVKIPKHEKTQNNPGYFVKEMGKAINRHAVKNKTIATLEQFCRTERSKKGFRELIAAVAADYVKKKTDSQGVADWIKGFGEGSGKDFANVLFSSDHSAAFHSVADYVANITKDEKLIIAVENIQSIDLDSLELLKRFLRDSNDLLVIGEYTQESLSSQEMHSFYDYFDDELICCNKIQLCKLGLEEILTACKDRPDIIIKILNEGYEKSSGNLHNLQVMLSEAFKDDSSTREATIQYDEIVADRITRLSPEESILLASIVAHGGMVDVDLLRNPHAFDASTTFSTNCVMSIETQLEVLEQKKLVLVNDGQVKILQDSIIDITLANRAFSKFLLVSYKSWLLFYKYIKDGGSDFFLSHSEILSWEIYFKAMLADVSGVGELLDEMYDLTLLSAAPRRALQYLTNLKNKIEKQVDCQKFVLAVKQIDRGIVRVLYRLGHFEEVLPLTERHMDDPLLKLFHASSLAVTGKSAEALVLCEAMLDDESKCIREGTLLIKMAALRASNKYEECKTMWQELHRDNIFVGSIMEGMFLRSADLALLGEFDQRITHLTNAAKIFEKNKETLQAFWTRNAMVQHLSYAGHLDAAKDQLDRASREATRLFSSHYVIENNYAVLELQHGRAGQAEILQLQKAAYLCDTSLDRFIIWSNLFIAQSMHGDLSGVARTLSMLEQAMQNDGIEDYDLQRIVLFNAAVHYLKCGEQDVANHYFSQAKELPLICDEVYWNAKLNCIEKDVAEDFRFSLDYYPVHISSWHFDFDIVLGNSQ